MIQQKTQSRAFSAFFANASSEPFFFQIGSLGTLGAVPWSHKLIWIVISWNFPWASFELGEIWEWTEVNLLILLVSGCSLLHPYEIRSFLDDPPVVREIIWIPVHTWRFTSSPFQETKQYIPVDEVTWSVLHIYIYGNRQNYGKKKRST